MTDAAHPYPAALQDIISLFENLPETERREMLVTYAENSTKWGPAADETFDLEDVRKDEECTDTVGIYLKAGKDADEQATASFKVSLGHEVQTLTRAMTSILCRGLNDSTLQAILDVPANFVPKIVGADLVRQRSQTVYYVLTRMKSAAKVYQNRLRQEAS